MNEKLRIIIKHYGIGKQLKYFQSEVFELNKAIIKERNTGCFENVIDGFLQALAPLMNQSYIGKNKEHIKEEIADVMVMLKQFQLYYDIPTDDIKKVMQSKINRQLERIAKEDKSNDR